MDEWTKWLSYKRFIFWGSDWSVWGNIYNETLLAKELSLRSEINFEPSVWGGDLYSKTGFAVTPELAISPQ